ncbi:hypothetical protein SAMD00019534_092920 [Acytostelium subglobosum LB1]|uniref:hypothetical protein n=1 Tax=Acytostelium subglobosum LB1 TaxID=1410327 RepID=UPI000644B01D|nr:hypothetical protein SAMD00019534_092920 [Acytostelium subglobosum LB1]GAM26117.1 hypothetical protein SAMD00019534_092920 [Acytostelium subglobosum LB1]|eukprot:XP_012751160.1 hypothetical protein SAMD00019534_092920 [Acytostelium subglobosum LB1]
MSHPYFNNDDAEHQHQHQPQTMYNQPTMFSQEHQPQQQQYTATSPIQQQQSYYDTSANIVFRPDKQQQQAQYSVSSPTLYNYSASSMHGHDHDEHDHGHSHGQHHQTSYAAVSPSASSTTSFYQSLGNIGSTASLYETRLTWRHMYDNLLNDSDAKKLAMWIVVMLVFTLYEIFYGAYLESLGLVSDGFHALFDCIGFMISLASILVGKKGSNREFTYGYDRWEILGVFSNGCFLLFVSFFLFLESTERLLEPPHIHNHGRVISLAFVSLLINITGILFFRKHSVMNEKGRARHENFMTITSHIFADSCTSVGVIFSALLGSTLGIEISDSLISIIIACIIVYDVLPICLRTGKVLLQTTPQPLVAQLNSACRETESIGGVLALKDKHFWTQAHGSYVGSIHVVVKDDCDEQQILKSVRDNFNFIQNLTVQVEKEHDHGHGHKHAHEHKQPKKKQHGHDHHGHGHDKHDDHHGHSHGVGHHDDDDCDDKEHNHQHDHQEHGHGHDEHDEHDDHHGHSHDRHDDHHGHGHDHHGHSHH